MVVVFATVRLPNITSYSQQTRRSLAATFEKLRSAMRKNRLLYGDDPLGSR